MPFIGQEPLQGSFHKLDAITTSATATYNLLLNGGAFTPGSANQLLVSLNGVIQSPGSSFTISGSQITFSSALTSSDSIDFIMSYGDVLNAGVPSDGAVSGSHIANGVITDAHMHTNLDLSGKTVTYGLTDSDMISGSIIQVSNTTNSATVTNSGSSTFTNSGTYVDFTPKQSNSIIIVHAQGHVYRNGGGHNWFRLINQSTGTASGNRGGRQFNAFHESVPVIWKDTSHNSTTQRRYELQFADRDNSGSISLSWNDGGSYESSITVFEIVS